MKQGQLPKGTIAKSLKKNFADTTQVLEEMCLVMKDFKRVHTHDFISLYEKKEEVEDGVVTLLVAYDNQQRIEKAINDAQDEVKTALKKKALNTSFSSVSKIPVVKMVNTQDYNTLCGFSGCQSNCHEPCYLEKSYDKSVFKYCASMQGGENCIECGHHYTYHYHVERRYEKTVEVNHHINESMRQEFNEARTMEERARILMEKFEAERNESEQKRKELSEELLHLLEEFHKLGMTRNYTKVVESQVAVINTRLQGTVGPETKHLRETKEELEKKLKLLEDTLKEPV